MKAINTDATSTSVVKVNASATARASTNATATTILNGNATATNVAITDGNATAITIANGNATDAAITDGNATATAAVVYPPSNGTLALNDPLSDNTLGYGWYQTNVCVFTGGDYHVTSPSSYFIFCAAQNTNYSNFAYEVQMIIISGDCGGIYFRTYASD
jgi:eukaryotic-like serine/threonine-protein kinase